MKTVLQRLLKYPHRAVFETSPDAEVALRVRHPLGSAWIVEDDTLRVTAGEDIHVYNLSSMTVGELVAGLQTDGFEVNGFNSAFAGMSAAVLVEGRGTEAESNGDRLQAFTSTLHSLYGGHAVELREVRRQIVEALRQMIIWQAEGEWLDLWGTLYNERRRQGETDASYAPRIPREAFRIRVNARAIEIAIKELTGKDVRIEEPWELMFRLDDSRLSDTHRLYDGDTVGPHLLRPVSRQSIDWTDVLAVIDRNRAAGVFVLPPETRFSGFVDASLNGTVWSGRTDLYATLAPFSLSNRLDYLVLSAEELTINWPVMLSQLISLSNSDGLNDPDSIAYRRTIAKASIVLSDGAPLGDENAVLPRAELTQLGGEMVVSDNLELSDPDQAPVWQPVDLIITETHSRGELDTGGPAGVDSGLTAITGGFVDAGIDGQTVVGILSSQFVDADVSAIGVRVDLWIPNINGYTWREAGVWGEFPWNISQYTVERLEFVASRADDYANQQLKDDLA